MRLQQVRLQNFRQHVDSTILFRPGITGIIGPNGAGKSTILEAIAWAIYGSSAARGTNDTIRFSRAQPRAKVVVDLAFEFDSHEYRVTRTLNSADLFLDNGITPLASGVGAVTAYLQNKLGMNRQEFFNTYFTGQKELQFLAQMGAAERGRFLAQVLGYERLRKAQNLAADKRKELKAQIDGLRTGLPDPDVLASESKAADQRVREAKKVVTKVFRNRDKLTADLAALTPRWLKAQNTRENARELTRTLENAQKDTTNAATEIDRIAIELKAIAEAEQQLKAARPQLKRLAIIATDCEKLEELARTHERKVAQTSHRQQLAKEVAQLRTKLDGLKQAPELLKQTREELKLALDALAAAEEEGGKLTANWNRDLQDVKTKLSIELRNQGELEKQLKRLDETGGSGPCPICTRPLEEEFETVHTHLEDELERIKQDINWHRRREQQLAKKPPALVEADKKVTALREVVDRKRERETKCTQAAENLWERGQELVVKEKRLAEMDELLSAIKEPYDRAQHEQLKAELAGLREVEKKARVYEHQVAQRGQKQSELAAAQARHAKAEIILKGAQTRLKELKFDETVFAKLGVKHEELSKASQAAQLEAVRAEDEMRAAEQALFTARRAQAAFDEKRLHLSTLENELRHHNEMDTAVAQLRAELNARVRPELAELASAHLSDITDGRYNALEIDDNYNVLVLEDGEEKPVISGGEEDIANLVLRVAISQMIAERAGQQLSTLFLDEVFGSLDLDRRDNVMQLLQKLHDRFEQVILITHIETVREGLDHVIRLEYDERTGASIVKDEVSKFEQGSTFNAEEVLAR
jgi:exonuclease SbcC